VCGTAVACCTNVSDPEDARRLGHASIGLSIAGIVVTILAIAAAIIISVASSD